MKSAGFIYICMCVYTNIMVVGEVFTLGYLTGSQRRSGNLEYAKPGKRINIYPSILSLYPFHLVSSSHCHRDYLDFIHLFRITNLP